MTVTRRASDGLISLEQDEGTLRIRHALEVVDRGEAVKAMHFCALCTLITLCGWRAA